MHVLEDLKAVSPTQETNSLPIPWSIAPEAALRASEQAVVPDKERKYHSIRSFEAESPEFVLITR